MENKIPIISDLATNTTLTAAEIKYLISGVQSKLEKTRL